MLWLLNAIQRQFNANFTPISGIPSECYGFATPSACETHAATGAEGYITTVVMRDDVIPRASPSRLRDLVRPLPSPVPSLRPSFPHSLAFLPSLPASH